jgi:hypothetical protein
MSDIQIKTQKLLSKFGVASSNFIGKGRESSAYAITDERVLKVFISGDLQFLNDLSQFNLELSKHKLPFQTPQILEVNSFEGLVYSIEKRLLGKELDQVFPNLDEERKFKVLKNYFDAFWFYNQITYLNSQFGQIISTSTSIRVDNWKDYLLRKFKQKLTAQPKLVKDILNYSEKSGIFESFINNNFNQPIEKSLVHADYYFTNVLVDDNLEISAVLDFGEHAVVGDRRLDVAAAVDFLNINPHVTEKMRAYVLDLARSKYGNDIDRFIAFYALFYNYYFADTKDKGLYNWSVKGLNDDKTWQQIA